jgi:hypothetical protein
MPQVADKNIINGCDVVIELEDVGGNWADISGDSNNISMDFSANIGSFKPFGQQWPRRFSCGRDGSITLDVVYGMDTAAGHTILKNWFFEGGNDSRKMRVYLPDRSPGSDLFEFRVVIETFPISAQADQADPIMSSISFQPDGDVHYSVVVD